MANIKCCNHGKLTMAQRKPCKRGTKYATTGKTSRLVKRMFGVSGIELIVTGRLKASAKNQTMLHFGQPNSVVDKRDCGIPVRVRLPQVGEIIETRLVPQWRLGRGMRTNKIRRLMRKHSIYNITEHKSGDLILEFR